MPIIVPIVTIVVVSVKILSLGKTKKVIIIVATSKVVDMINQIIDDFLELITFCADNNPIKSPKTAKNIYRKY